VSGRRLAKFVNDEQPIKGLMNWPSWFLNRI
jgi:hypothetical protein